MVVYCCTFMKNVIKNNALNVSKLIIGLLSIACCNTAFAQQNNIQLLAAYEGNPEAQFQLALSYSTQTPNSKLAAYWYKQAARQGMANAQYNLGHFYLQGIGVKQNTDETIKWWQQSAHQDYAPAQHNMGTAYFEGIGVEKNYILAEQWFMRCAKLGNSACKESLEIVRNNPDASDKPTPKTEQIKPQTEASTQTLTPEQNNKKIKMHINASATSEVIAELNSSDEYSVLSSGKDWQQVQLKQPIAIWAYKAFVSIENSTGTLTGDKVRARTAPSINNSKIVTELNIDSQFTVLEEKGKWVKLALNDYIAWTPIIDQPQAVTTTPAIATISNSKNAEPEQTTLETVALEPIDAAKDISTIKDPKKLNTQYSFLDRRSDDEWLFSAAPEKFTVVLGNYDNSKALTEFSQDNPLLKQNLAHLLLSKRGNIEWKYVLYGNFDNTEEAISAVQSNGFKNAFIAKIGNIQEQRCSAWKTTIPSPKTLDKYCLKKTASTS